MVLRRKLKQFLRIDNSFALSNFTLHQMGMSNAAQNTVTLLAPVTEATQCATLLILLPLLLLLYC